MITRIRIKGFRGILEGELSGLDQFTVLVGRNGSGKSSVLEALYLASACAAPQDPVRGVDKLDYIVGRRGGRGGWDDSRTLLWHAGDVRGPIEVEVDVNRGGTLKFAVANVNNGWRPVRLTIDGRLVELVEGSAVDSVQELEKRVLGRLAVNVAAEPFAGVRRFLEGFLLVDGLLAGRPELVERFAWPKLLPRRLDKLVLELVREEFEPDAEGLTYMPMGPHYYLTLQKSKTVVRVDDLGDGARAALLAAMLILAYEPSVLLVEEPELHMHPGGLYAYTRFLLNLAKSAGFQVIATTHSLEFIHIAHRLSGEAGLGLSLLYLEREDGRLKARSFTPEEVDVLRGLGIDPRLLHKF